jgi:hypothetical protein
VYFKRFGKKQTCTGQQGQKNSYPALDRRKNLGTKVPEDFAKKQRKLCQEKGLYPKHGQSIMFWIIWKEMKSWHIRQTERRGRRKT